MNTIEPYAIHFWIFSETLNKSKQIIWYKSTLSVCTNFIHVSVIYSSFWLVFQSTFIVYPMHGIFYSFLWIWSVTVRFSNKSLWFVGTLTFRSCILMRCTVIQRKINRRYKFKKKRNAWRKRSKFLSQTNETKIWNIFNWKQVHCILVGKKTSRINLK